VNFNAEDAKAIRKGAQSKLSSATLAQNFAAFAFQSSVSIARIAEPGLFFGIVIP
jgi:hypothetical protein